MMPACDNIGKWLESIACLMSEIEQIECVHEYGQNIGTITTKVKLMIQILLLLIIIIFYFKNSPSEISIFLYHTVNICLLESVMYWPNISMDPFFINKSCNENWVESSHF